MAAPARTTRLPGGRPRPPTGIGQGITRGGSVPPRGRCTVARGDASLHGNRARFHGSDASLHGNRARFHGSDAFLHGNRARFHASDASLYEGDPRLSFVDASLRDNDAPDRANTAPLAQIIPLHPVTRTSILSLPGRPRATPEAYALHAFRRKPN